MGIDAAHVDLDFGNLFDVLHKEVKTLLNQSVDLQEVRRNQDGHCIFDVKFWTIVLLNSTLLIGAIGLTFLNCKLPTASPSDAVQHLVALLFLLELLHGENVVEQPLENNRVTVDRNIDLILVRDFLKTLVEILHIFNK